MPIQILMPALSPTMKEGNLAKWLKKQGDKVSPGDIIAEIETDKATMEVESIDEGIIAKIIVPAGTQNVAVNSLIAIILEEGESADALDSFQTINISINENKEESLKKDNEVNLNVEKDLLKIDRIFVSPLAKRIASDKNIDLSRIQGSGPHGRIVKCDVESAIMNDDKNLSDKNLPDKKISNYVGRNISEYKTINNSIMRKIIAKRLLESKQTIPHFYLDIDCKMDKLLSAREDLNNDIVNQKIDVKLSVNDFIVKACSLALRDVPEANASWTEDAILQYNNVDLSIAVAVDGGLITPIVRNADQKSLIDISTEIKDLAFRAKKNSLAPEEFQGGGFTISNLGMYGISHFNAIINPPQSAILAVGKAEERPVVINGTIMIATILQLSLSCDHRVIDGAVGAKYLASLKKYIENPVLMLL